MGLTRGPTIQRVEASRGTPKFTAADALKVIRVVLFALVGLGLVVGIAQQVRFAEALANFVATLEPI